jgi:hypothetical protein
VNNLIWRCLLISIVVAACGDFNVPFIEEYSVKKGSGASTFKNKEGQRCRFVSSRNGPEVLVCCGETDEWPVYVRDCGRGHVALGCLIHSIRTNEDGKVVIVNDDDEVPDDRCRFYGSDDTVTECVGTEQCRECRDRVTWVNGAHLTCE